MGTHPPKYCDKCESASYKTKCDCNPMTPEKKEPREYWIDEDWRVFETIEEVHDAPERLLRVIEHSAYRELEEANKRLKAAIEKLKEQRNTQALKANPNFEEEFILGLVKTQYDSEIDRILNPTMEK